MRRSTIPLLTGLVVVGTAVAVGRNLMVPRRRTASRAEILTVLPASLKATDAPDPAGEARYARLVAMLEPVPDGDFSTAFLTPSNAVSRERIAASRARIRQACGGLDALLTEGGFRCPTRRPGMLFKEAVKFKGVAKALALDATDAARRGDQESCARLVALDLRFTQALVDDEGVLIDELVAIAAQAVANRAAYEAEMAGGLDAAGRARVLALMPPLTGTTPELGDALRRDFQVTMMPFLAADGKGRDALLSEMGVRQGDSGGTFDAVETARLIGRIDDAQIADASRPYRLRKGEGERIAEAAGRDLPAFDHEDPPSEGIEGFWMRFKYRVEMNAQPNTIGRGLASTTIFNISGVGAHRAVGRNLERAAILLHGGGKPTITDPYGTGPLRIDPKRRIVWSVGVNGRDDGGRIGKGGAQGEPDYGYPYGAGSWPPPKSTVPGGPPPGAPSVQE